MANQGQNNKDVYDTVFDFIFDAQKKKEKKPIPKTPGLSSVSENLLEIGTQPAIYPLESAFAAINGALDKASEVSLGGGVSGGLGSGAFTNPIKYSKAEIAKNRAKAKWASIGGSLHKEIDTALVSLYSKSLGLEGKSAAQIGQIFKDLMEQQQYSMRRYKDLLPYRTPEEKASETIEKKLLDDAISLKSNLISSRYSNINKKLLSQHIKQLQGQSSKNERIRETFNMLIEQGLSKKESLDIAQSLWGSTRSFDNGLYRIGKDQYLKNVKELQRRYGLSDNDIRKLREYGNIEDPQERRRKIYFLLKREKGLDKKQAFEFSKDISNFKFKMNNGEKIAEDVMYSTLAKQLREKLRKEGKDVSKISDAELEAQVKKMLDPYGRNTLGMRAERAVLAVRWISNMKAWNTILLTGTWEKFGVGEGLGFTNIVEEKMATKDGEIIGRYFVPADSAIGKIMGGAYYFHPNNLINGLFVDGSLWLKWASNEKGEINGKSFAYFMSQLTLGRSLSAASKPIKALSENLVKLISPIFEKLQIGIKNIAKKLIGATGVGGLLINLLMNVVSDKFAQIMNQVIVMFILAIAGVIFALFEGLGALYSDEYAEVLLEDQAKGIQGVSDINKEIFTDQDFFIEEEE
jgi:hypothetical protein